MMISIPNTGILYIMREKRALENLEILKMSHIVIFLFFHETQL